MMANVRTVGPLRLWTAHGSRGRRLVCELAGERTEYRADAIERDARLAWQAYREHDERAARELAGAPEVRSCARCGASTTLTEQRPNGDGYALCCMCEPLTPAERLLMAVAGVSTLPELDRALRRASRVTDGQRQRRDRRWNA